MEEALLAWLVPMAFAIFAGAFLTLRLHGVGSFWWPAAFALAACAFAVTILPVGTWPAAKASFEDFLFLCALACFTYGVGTRYRRRPRLRVVAPVMLLASLGAAVSLAVYQSVQGEVIIVQTACAVLLGESARIMSGSMRRPIDKLILMLTIGFAASLLLQNLMVALMLDEALTIHDWRLSAWSTVFQLSGATTGLLFAITILVAIGIDVMETLRQSSATDPLSGLLNRRGFEARSHALLAGGLGEREACVIVLDIDHFKRVNDEYGHAVGDAVICAMGSMLEDIAGKNSCVGRLGGEEFAVLVSGKDLVYARDMAERMRQAFAETRWPAPMQAARLTASFGATDLAAHETLALASMRADRLLYLAKHGGRNRLCWCSSASYILMPEAAGTGSADSSPVANEARAKDSVAA